MEGSAVTDGGGTVASLSRQAEAVRLAPGVERVLSRRPAGVRNTPLTHRTYASKWKLFVSWCIDCALNPVDCPISVVLDFLQDLLDAGRSPAMLKVFVAALSAYREQVSICANRLVVVFLKGAVYLKPPVRVETRVTSETSDPFDYIGLPVVWVVRKWGGHGEKRVEHALCQPGKDRPKPVFRQVQVKCGWACHNVGLKLASLGGTSCSCRYSPSGTTGLQDFKFKIICDVQMYRFHI
ncbi:hypothetical protein DPX16_1187 [Anabarilius grahami]|uniref:Uncharacterized protein n=1 Tax=Anabarilius grahami TaxID=495550 RepID=A0A3N0YUD9_ANAGA|nr:hypothetical protein DPX16_1187 [Anabarilius grahami]